MIAGMRQSELADTVGVRPQTVWRIESGRQRPSLEVARRIARALGVSLDQLLSTEPSIPPANPLTEGQ